MNRQRFTLVRYEHERKSHFQKLKPMKLRKITRVYCVIPWFIYCKEKPSYISLREFLNDENQTNWWFNTLPYIFHNVSNAKTIKTVNKFHWIITLVEIALLVLYLIIHAFSHWYSMNARLWILSILIFEINWLLKQISLI